MSAATHRRRLEKLEQAAGISDGAICACKINSVDVRAYTGRDSQAAADADTKPARVCARCHKPMKVIQIVVVHGPRKPTDYLRASVEGHA